MSSEFVELSRSYAHLRQTHGAVLTLLDQVEIGLCIALPDATTLIRNVEFDRILESHRNLSLSIDGRLGCHDEECNFQLAKAVQDACGSTASPGISRELLLISNRQLMGRTESDSLLIDISPLGDTRSYSDKSIDGALITIIDPLVSRPFSMSRAIVAFGLTESEGVVCRLLVDGYTTKALAEKRSVSVETIKSQVKSVFRKTGCKRRAELIRVVLNTAPPISRVLSQPE